MKHYVTLFAGLLLGLSLLASELKVISDNNIYQIQILDNEGNTLIQTPPNHMWRIATQWDNQWMSDWKTGNATEIKEVNGYTIVSGKIELAQGDMLVRDSYINDKGRIKCTRRYTWTGTAPLPKTTLAIEFLAKGKSKKVFMPGILYYGNPSGEKSNHTPIYHGKEGEFALFEEHRFPMPFVSLEWGGDELSGAALHSVPTPVPHANLNDQWWSLGIETTSDGSVFKLLSGPCGFNGKTSVIKTHQGKRRSMFTPYDNAYLNLKPGAIIEKTFYLEVYDVQKEGSGFQQPLYTSIDIFNPILENMPVFDEIIRGKYEYAINQWLEGDGYAGFNQFSGESLRQQQYIVLGWVGQAAAPGYAFQYLKPAKENMDALEMAQKSLDHVSTATFYDEGMYTWYDVKKGEWGGRIWKANPEILSQGQCMLNVANAILASDNSGLNPEKWKAFLKKASDFHSQRILSKDWNPASTDEGFFIAPLCLASEILDDPAYKKAAVKAGEHYAKRNLDMTEVYWGGTLDASCEDKEGAFAAFQGFLALYELTGEQKYLDWAKHAGDITISYTYVWDVELPAGRLRDHDFKTRGWTAVSVQNMHIDVYGVLISPFVYKLGKYLEDDNLKDLAKLMFRSCGQLMDPYGSQGEQPQQTNYTQDNGAPDDYTTYRGNYVEDWTVFWITAHFLTAGAIFEEMGVEL